MNFVAPYMILGAAAAGIPIALHFFFRSRYRTVPWAAMKFLLMAVEQTSRRLKFQELLLLIVRCAVLVVLAIALARPLLTGVASSGKEAVDAVFVFDTSYSMGAREGKQTRLDLAKAAALAVLDHLPAHSTVQVVTCADHANLLGPREPGNLDQVRQLIKGLELTDLATDLEPGASKAVAAFARGSSPNKELYFFSDMQKLGWEHNASALTRTLKDFSENGSVYLVHCATQTPRNVAVVGIVPQSELLRPNERVGFAVLVRNTGAVALKSLRVTLALDGASKPEEQPLPELGAGETRTVTLSVKLGKAGLHVLTASVRDDDLEADNHYSQAIQVRDEVRVLVVDGSQDEREPSRSSAYFLEHALTPVNAQQAVKFHIRPTARTPRRVSAEDLRTHDLCVLVNVALERSDRGGEVPPAKFIEKLGEFVRKGNGLIIFPGDHVVPESYNRILGKQLGLLPVEVAGFTTFPEDKPGQIERKSIEASSFLPFREDEDYKGFGFIPILRTLDFKEPVGEKKEGVGPVRVLMRYVGDKPAVVSRKVDAGEVLLFATSAGPEWKPGTKLPSWNYLYMWGGYVPLVQASLNHLLHRRTQNHNFSAGQTLHWHPGPDPAAEARRQAEGGADLPDARSFVLIHPPRRPAEEGKREPLGRPQMVQGQPVVSASGLHRAGVYYLTTADRSEGGGRADPDKAPLRVPFAVVPDLRESVNLESLTAAQLDQRLGFQPTHLKTDGNVNMNTATERTNREWTLWLLVAVLVLVVGEAVLAWFCGKAW
jgi:hypothetical protein